jgi:hypothetical protein
MIKYSVGWPVLQLVCRVGEGAESFQMPYTQWRTYILFLPARGCKVLPSIYQQQFFACDLEIFAVAEYLTGLQEAARLLQTSLLPLLSMLHPGPEHLR